MGSSKENVSDCRKNGMDIWSELQKKICFRIQEKKRQKSNAVKKIICILKLEEANGIIHEEKKKKKNLVYFTTVLISDNTAWNSRTIDEL
jgi:hypothetical protein